MTLDHKRIVIAVLSLLFLGSLLIVQWLEVQRRAVESGLVSAHIAVPESSKTCVECHDKKSKGIVDQWRGSTHAKKGVGCLDCHTADPTDADAYPHEGSTIATIVTPLDCSRCHPQVFEEFSASHHAKAGNILASLDNFLAEVAEGGRQIEKGDDGKVKLTDRVLYDPHSKTMSRRDLTMVNGAASATVGCKQCHGSLVALEAIDGPPITMNDLAPGKDGKPTNQEAVQRIRKDENGKPKLDHNTWPNT
ncbi:MAG: multiheme c-type cytochrome, partial [Planctomycetota bacterium]